jgi:hypothetical protein
VSARGAAREIEKRSKTESVPLGDLTTDQQPESEPKRISLRSTTGAAGSKAALTPIWRRAGTTQSISFGHAWDSAEHPSSDSDSSPAALPRTKSPVASRRRCHRRDWRLHGRVLHLQFE